MGRHRIPGAEPLQCANGIGPQLQAGANFFKIRGFFQDMGGLADAGQAQGRGKARYSAADNEKR